MKYTKETPLDDIIADRAFILSNGKRVYINYRATLYAYLQRGYYQGEKDKIERAMPI